MLPPPQRLCRLFDTHSHIHVGMLRKIPSRPLLPNTTVCVLGTQEQDWDAVADMGGSNITNVVVGYGLHPWFLAERSEHWLEELERRIVSEPNSIVGECGLDKLFSKRNKESCPLSLQVEVLRDQLALGAELNRPASIHCVRAHGTLLDTIKSMEHLPPALALHSFSGGVDVVKSFLNSRAGGLIFFGLSAKVNLKNSNDDKLGQVIAAIPDERLLLETDQDDSEEVGTDLNSICERIAGVKGWSIEETAARTFQNAQLFFGIASQGDNKVVV